MNGSMHGVEIKVYLYITGESIYSQRDVTYSVNHPLMCKIFRERVCKRFRKCLSEQFSKRSGECLHESKRVSKRFRECFGERSCSHTLFYRMQFISPIATGTPYFCRISHSIILLLLLQAAWRASIAQLLPG